MLIDILSLFPEYFQSPFSVSIMKRAIENNQLSLKHVDIRSFSMDRHKKVDERPFGGGPGMVMMAQPVVDAVRSVKKPNSHVIYLSPQGEKLTAKKCRELSSREHLILVCGHYEGIDQRALDLEVDEEISIGDYVLSNGCAAAVVLVDAVMRFIPDVLGHPEAASKDTFEENMLFEGPQYTRPETYENITVPEVLRNGNHAEIEKFRKNAGIIKMKKKRPDLYLGHLIQTKQQNTKLVKSKESSSEPHD